MNGTQPMTHNDRSHAQHRHGVRSARVSRSTLHARRRGVSLIELLLALAISAMLLTATMVALSASFKAYADASEQASAQAATRMVTQRLLTLIRTGTAHGPLNAEATTVVRIKDANDTNTTYTINLAGATISGNVIAAPYLDLMDASGTLIRVAYLQYTDKDHQARQELWLFTNPGAPQEQSQPLIGGVTAAQFTCLRRMDMTTYLYVLQRGTMDLTVQPGADATLTLEHGAATPIRVIASTAPRKLD
jgi:prepilin-type N-terminal cleavage/methylation domain-containing protein